MMAGWCYGDDGDTQVGCDGDEAVMRLCRRLTGDENGDGRCFRCCDEGVVILSPVVVVVVLKPGGDTGCCGEGLVIRLSW